MGPGGSQELIPTARPTQPFRTLGFFMLNLHPPLPHGSWGNKTKNPRPRIQVQSPSKGAWAPFGASSVAPATEMAWPQGELGLLV